MLRKAAGLQEKVYKPGGVTTGAKLADAKPKQVVTGGTLICGAETGLTLISTVALAWHPFKSSARRV